MPSSQGPAAAAGSAVANVRTPRGQLRLAGLLHPFSWGSKAPVLDTAAFERELAGSLGITSVASRVPPGVAAHQLSLSSIGSHRIAAWVGTAVEIEAAAAVRPTLYLLRGGWLEWQEYGRYEPLEPGWLLYLNSGAYRLRTGLCSVVAISFERLRLEVQLHNLAASALGPETCGQVLRRTLCTNAARSAWLGLAKALASLLLLYEQLELVEPKLVTRLELDQLLERLLAALLLTASGGLESLDLARAMPPTARQDVSFEALLARIRANLAEPLDLATLEVWAQRSRREVQMMFRDRLGCTPMQWLRRERLNLARRRLQHPQPGDTVAAIARACGFASAAHFCSQFRRQFGTIPSQLLRTAQQGVHP